MIGARPPQQEFPKELSWANNVPDKTAPAPEDDAGPRQVTGSKKTYTEEQINNPYNPPDWFPDEHPPMPQVVEHGNGKEVLACILCHLTSGLGHPQSGNVAGLPLPYLVRQLAEFKSGARKDRFMSRIAMNLPDDEARQAAEWFAALKPRAWVKVVESDTVPAFFVDKQYMRVPLPGGETEALGNRIIEMPQETSGATSRDPHSGFVAYAPIGSIARGEALVKAGPSGKSTACVNCHGETLEGMGEAPRIAGLLPSYAVRQFYGIQSGTRAGVLAELMKPVVAHMSKDDMMAIAAYLASRAR